MADSYSLENFVPQNHNNPNSFDLTDSAVIADDTSLETVHNYAQLGTLEAVHTVGSWVGAIEEDSPYDKAYIEMLKGLKKDAQLQAVQEKYNEFLKKYNL